jgi:hypothetical protein
MTEAILKRLPVITLLAAGQDYAEGGTDKMVANLVIPGELVNDIAAVGANILSDSMYERSAGHWRERLKNAGYTDAEVEDRLSIFVRRDWPAWNSMFED